MRILELVAVKLRESLFAQVDAASTSGKGSGK